MKIAREPTSWDWVEQKRSVYGIAPEVDDYVNSLVENGVNIQVQLMYGNPMYTSPSGKLPDQIVPEPGGFYSDDRSIHSNLLGPHHAQPDWKPSCTMSPGLVNTFKDAFITPLL